MATVKQKIAVKKVLNGSPIGKAMREAGYAVSTSTAGGKLTNSKGWAELVEEFISDKALAKVHKEGLHSTTYFNEIVGRDSKGAPEYHLKQVPDFAVRHKYLESGYKLKGRYSSDSQGNKVLIINITEAAAKKYAINASPGTSNS